MIRKSIILSLTFLVVFVSVNAQVVRDVITDRFSLGASYLILSDKQTDFNFVGISIKSVDTSNIFVATNLYFPLVDNAPYKYIFEGDIGKYSKPIYLFNKNGLKTRWMTSLSVEVIEPNDRFIKNKNYVIYGIGASLGLEVSYKFVVLDIAMGPQWDTENHLYSKFSTSLKFAFDKDWIK